MANTIIGLTGGIGSGKTAATDYLSSKGIVIVDADIVARKVVEKGSEALQQIVVKFGNDILLTDGTLNRRALREIIFSNPEEKQWLESLLHPIINKSIREQLHAAESDYAILVSPLLLETQQKTLVNKIILIDVEEEIQIERASARDKSYADNIKKIIASQMPRAEKQEYADYIVDNRLSLEHLYTQLDTVHDDILTGIKPITDLSNKS